MENLSHLFPRRKGEIAVFFEPSETIFWVDCDSTENAKHYKSHYSAREVPR